MREKILLIMNHNETVIMSKSNQYEYVDEQNYKKTQHRIIILYSRENCLIIKKSLLQENSHNFKKK